MKLIVGLGNPGKDYEKTRHNIGFFILDQYLNDVDWKKEKDAYIYETKRGREKIIFLKPQQYMNLSGIAVKKYLKYYKINIDNLLVIYDDIDLEIGKVKEKSNSGSGGHNGVQSIIDYLGTNEFKRIKIGVSKNNLIDTKDYVLGKFLKKEREIINEIMPTIFEKIEKFINNKM